MKAKELMIGDYVEDIDFGIVEIIAIIFEGGEYTIVCDTLEVNYKPFIAVSPQGLKPIPLTPEILEKNRFKKYRKKCYRLDIAEGVYINADFTADEPFCSIHNRCYYASPIAKHVHLLQHAMRSCGIDKEIMVKEE